MYIKHVSSFRGSNAITGFSKMLGGPEYSPFIRTYEFSFSGNTDFTYENLQQVLHQKTLIGEVAPSNKQAINDLLHNAFSWKVNGQGEIAKTNNESLVKARILFFWDCLQEEFNESFENFFIYTPEQSCYFAQTTLWNLCFIIVSNQRGIIVTGKTWENDEDCPFENPDEERLRNVFDMV